MCDRKVRPAMAPSVACPTRAFFLLAAVPEFFIVLAFFAGFSPSIFLLPFLFNATGIAVIGGKIDGSLQRKVGG